MLSEKSIRWLYLQAESNRVRSLSLSVSDRLQSAVAALPPALASRDPEQVERVVQVIADEVCLAFRVPTVRVRVLFQRPHDRRGELHGAYVRSRLHPAEIRVWMLTAKRQQVAAPKTFLRTVVHELCHHLDYKFLRLLDSVHSTGFYQRESSLLRQLTQHVPPELFSRGGKKPQHSST